MGQSGKRQVPGAAWLALILGCACFIFSTYLRYCPAILALDLQGSFGTDASGVTMLSSATLVGYGIMQMPSGIITDAIGGRKTVALFMFCSAAATLIFAISPNLHLATAARFITGLSVAAMPPLGVVLAVSFPRERYTQALGLLMATGGLGGIIAAEPLARLSIALGWRGAMLSSAVTVGLLGLAALLIFREAPGKTPWTGFAPQMRKIATGMRRLFRSPQIRYLASWQIFSSITQFSFLSMWAGPYLMEGRGLDKITASRVLFMSGVVSMLAVPLISALADRFNSRRLGLFISGGMALMGSLALALFPGTLPWPLITLCTMTMMVCGLAGATCVFSLIRRNLPPDLTGTGIGCVNMLWPFLAALMNVVFGLVLGFFTGGAGAGELARPELAAAYGKTIFLYVGCYVAALICAVFFIKEEFSLDEK